MKPSFETMMQELRERNISLSHHRLKVLEHLSHTVHHPTADELFMQLKKEIPTLSKTTVYNTLRMLEEAGFLKTVRLEGQETRYDISPPDHGHFKCLSCGTISDVPMDLDALFPSGMGKWQVHETSVYFKGICADCLLKQDKINEGGLIW